MTRRALILAACLLAASCGGGTDPKLRPPPVWSIGEIRLAPGQSFDLRATLPAGLPAGGSFRPHGGALPAGLRIDGDRLIADAGAPAAMVTLRFAYDF